MTEREPLNAAERERLLWLLFTLRDRYGVTVKLREGSQRGQLEAAEIVYKSMASDD